jgi:hypothetical protein
MGHRIDEVALTPIQIDVLNNPDQIQNHSRQQKRKQNRPNAEQNPIDPRTTVLLRIQSTENIQQNPTNGQPNHADDHQRRNQNRPFQTFSLKQDTLATT